MSSTEQQIKNLNGDIMVLYIPRVHLKHSSRDIRSTFVGLGFGIKLNVDIAYNPSTGFNMAFVFFDMTDSPSENLKILRCCLSRGQDVRVFPKPETSREFWMILPSNADHESDESNQLLENAFKPTIQLDVHISPVNALKIQEIFNENNQTHPCTVVQYVEELKVLAHLQMVEVEAEAEALASLT